MRHTFSLQPWIGSVLITVLALCSTVISSTASSTEMITVRVSVSTDNKQALDADTENFLARPDISDNGRFVVFESLASTLVADDTNVKNDVFLRDRELQTTVKISEGFNGEGTNGNSFAPRLTGDGRYIVFASDASNLAENDNNNVRDIFVYDTTNKQTEMISIAENGDYFDGMSMLPDISADGRYVVFQSLARNWGEDDTNNTWDALLHDRETKKTITTNVSSEGIESHSGGGIPSISADGLFVCFGSSASNLVSGDTNREYDIFLYDVLNKQTLRVNVASDGTQSSGFIDSDGLKAKGDGRLCSLSGDGRYIAFQSQANNLVPNDLNENNDVFVHDRILQITERVSLTSTGEEGDGHSGISSISSNGRYIAFQSNSSNFSDNSKQDHNQFIKDRELGTIKLATYATDGTTRVSSGFIYMQSTISGDGQHLVFRSGEGNLVQDDNNANWDTFVHGPAIFQLEIPKDKVVEVEPKKTSSGGGISFVFIIMLALTNISRRIASKAMLEKS